MKTSFIKEKINGVSWYMPKDKLAQESISIEYLLNKLKEIDEHLFLTDGSDSNTIVFRDLKLKPPATQKRFIPIKTGRRKIFGIMNLLDKSGEYDVYIKIFNCSSLLLKLKHLFIPSKAKREFVLSSKINELGIPAIFSIAAGDEKSMGILKRSYLIVKKINNVINLKEFFYDHNLKPADKHHVIEKFGKIARLSHNHGILQTDFALNNFLVQRLENKGFCVYLIDYERTKILKKITDKNRFWTLAKLNRVGPDFTTCDKFRFLRSYLNCGQNRLKNLNTIPEIKKWMQDLDRETTKLLKDGAAKVWKDSIKGERKFKIFRGRNYRGHILKRHNADVLIDMANDFNNYKKVEEINFCNSIKITSFVTELHDKGKDEIIQIYKIYSNDSNIHNAFWQNSNALVKARINVIKPIGVFLKDRLRRDTENIYSNAHSKMEGYLITSFIPSMLDLKEYFQDISLCVDRMAFLSKLARFIFRLHNFGKFVTAISSGDIAVNVESDKYNFYFAHTYNFLFNISLSREDRMLDIERIACYFGDKIKDEELNFFNEMYAKNEKWYRGS